MLARQKEVPIPLKPRVARATSGLLIMILIGSCLLMGCAKPEEPILGRWQLVNGNQILNFYRDGTLEIAAPGGFGNTQSGTYQLIDKKHIRIQTQGIFSPGSTVYEFTIDGDSLAMVDAQARRLTYQRLR